jgi:hypothetical protein
MARGRKIKREREMARRRERRGKWREGEREEREMARGREK